MSPARRLMAGDVYELPADCGDAGRRYEVLRVTPCSAVVRAQARVERTVVTGSGQVKTFSAPAGTFTISPNASVVIVSRRAA